MQTTILKYFLIVVAIALIIAAAYDYLTPGGAVATGVAIRILLYGLRKFLLIAALIIVFIYFIQHGGDTKIMSQSVDEIQKYINEGFNFLETQINSLLNK